MTRAARVADVVARAADVEARAVDVVARAEEERPRSQLRKLRHHQLQAGKGRGRAQTAGEEAREAKGQSAQTVVEEVRGKAKDLLVSCPAHLVSILILALLSLFLVVLSLLRKCRRHHPGQSARAARVRAEASAGAEKGRVAKVQTAGDGTRGARAFVAYDATCPPPPQKKTAIVFALDRGVRKQKLTWGAC